MMLEMGIVKLKDFDMVGRAQIIKKRRQNDVNCSVLKPSG